MTQTSIHRNSSFLKLLLPKFFWELLRGVATALLTPIRFSLSSGHFQSSLKAAAVTSSGAPIPWYTDPAIDFLRGRDFSQKLVLEFGGGNSSLWWALHAKRVCTFEGDLCWYSSLLEKCPKNLSLNYSPFLDTQNTCKYIRSTLIENYCSEKFDIVVIDGLCRFELISLAIDYLSDDGIIICDNSEGYGFFEGFKGTSFSRIDFYGYAPGVYLPHVTSIFFRLDTKFFANDIPIRVPALD